ncbi:hypothetical protein G7Z99_15985 [Pseudomonas entomophila]|uniref:hypothetical protein n=1 Tax=Pseudomonas entomophila TaxID=312306 RepID=UPI0015E43DDE|nr:hypothetical protein [Pseudomonas entomophila]MBA1190536.1 hypothetical protein [Pseudomonas entomophila]
MKSPSSAYPDTGAPRPVTACSSFGTCNHAHEPTFMVRAGIDSEDALVCAVAALKAAYETNATDLEKADEPLRSLLMATENSLEKGLALAEAVLHGIEAN